MYHYTCSELPILTISFFAREVGAECCDFPYEMFSCQMKKTTCHFPNCLC